MIAYSPRELRERYDFIVHIGRHELFGILNGRPPDGIMKCRDAYPTDIHGFGKFAIARGDALCGDYHAPHDKCDKFEAMYACDLAMHAYTVADWKRAQKVWALDFIIACQKEYTNEVGIRMKINGREVIRTAYQRGYISRKVKIDEQPVLHGRRGDYILAPCYESTQYCKRYYLAEEVK